MNKETEKFSKLAGKWWDEEGELRTLHDINPIRIKYISDLIKKEFLIDSLADLSIIDIGCGAGIVCEPLARKNAQVTGIDASNENIQIAKKHSLENDLNINYLNQDFNKIEISKKFDVILALEIIEHIDDIELFFEKINLISHEGSLIIISTINRNFKAYMKAIFIAEKILKIVPEDTHEYERFLKPSEIFRLAIKYSMKHIESKGMEYNPVTKEAKLTDNLDVNYFISFRKT